MSAAVSDRGIGGSGRPPAPSIDVIIRVVADDFDLTRREMLSHRRDKVLVLARQVAMWLARRLTSLSFPQIGQRFDGRDHTTIMYGCSRIDDRMTADADLAERIIGLLSALRQGMAA